MSTFGQYLRVVLDEFGPSLNQETARLFVLSYREYKEDNEALQALLSPRYRETKAFSRVSEFPFRQPSGDGSDSPPDDDAHARQADKITQLVRQLSEEVKVADIMFLSDICDNDEERKLLLNSSGSGLRRQRHQDRSNR